MANSRRRKSGIMTVVIVILSIVVVVLLGILVVGLMTEKANEENSTSVEVAGPQEVNESPNTVIHKSSYEVLPDDKGIPVAQIDVDIDKFKAINNDVCGWIYIPDAGVNCPVVCNENAPDFYLTNDIEGLNGVFLQSYNRSDFTDRMTVIYGKNQNGKSQFEGILKYRDKTFFDDHRYMYVLSDDKVLTYKIFAAHKAYAEHLMLGYDWSVDQVFIDYLTYIIKSGESFVQEDVETALDIDPDGNIDGNIDISINDRVLTLSQRIDGEDNYRYLVQGVLVNESIKEIH